MSDRLLRWGAPAALLLVTALHPIADPSNVAESIRSSLLRWQLVHLSQPLLFALVALAVYRLLPTGAGWERGLARASLATFAIAATAFDAMLGLSTGMLAALAGTDPGRASLVQNYWSHRLSEPVVGIAYLVTATGWLLGLAAVAVARRRVGASLPSLAPLASAGLLAVDHAPPFGPAAMVGLLVATAVAHRATLIPSSSRWARRSSGSL